MSLRLLPSNPFIICLRHLPSNPGHNMFTTSSLQTMYNATGLDFRIFMRPNSGTYGCQCLWFWTRVQMMKPAIPHGGCTNTAKESALKVVFLGKKITCHTWESNPRQYAPGFSVRFSTNCPKLSEHTRCSIQGPWIWKRCQGTDKWISDFIVLLSCFRVWFCLIWSVRWLVFRKVRHVAPLLFLQRCLVGTLLPSCFSLRGDRTVERALGTVVLSGFSEEGTELWNVLWGLCSCLISLKKGQNYEVLWGLRSCHVSLKRGQNCEVLWGLWSCLVSLKRGQNCGTCSGDCGPVWFLWKGDRTVERALGTVVLSGFSKEGTELWKMWWSAEWKDECDRQLRKQPSNEETTANWGVQ